MTDAERCVFVRLQGPMQSWGNNTRGANGAHRTTHSRPTKSGVVGLVANALGRDFADSIGDLAALRFGVRTDIPGALEVDSRSTGGGSFPLLPGEAYRNPRWMRRARSGEFLLTDNEYPGAANVKVDPVTAQLVADPGNVVITQDWYLADASFLAALVGSPTLVDDVAEALAKPRRPLYLGRRAHLPSHAVFAGTCATSDMAAALSVPLRANGTRTGHLLAWMEPPQSGSALERAVAVSDQPASFGGPVVRAARLELAIRVDPPYARSARSRGPVAAGAGR